MIQVDAPHMQDLPSENMLSVFILVFMFGSPLHLLAQDPPEVFHIMVVSEHIVDPQGQTAGTALLAERYMHTCHLVVHQMS